MNLETLIVPFTALSAISTAFLAWLAWQQYRATHRPRIVFLQFVYVPMDDSTDEVPGVTVSYVNAGTTPAWVTEIGAKITTSVDKLAVAEFRTLRLPEVKLESGEERKDEWQDVALLVAKIVPELQKDDPAPECACAGYVAYTDKRGLKRKTGFCRVLDPASKTWLRVADSDYEYSY